MGQDFLRGVLVCEEVRGTPCVFLGFYSFSGPFAAQLANAADTGSKEDAVKMVKRVQEMFHRAGPQATFAAVTAKDRQFHDRDLYPFIYGLSGINVAHGAKPELVGKNLLDFQDENGKFLIRDMIEVALGPGRGWVDYRWSNPTTGKIEDKSAYVEKMGDYLVGVGVYPSSLSALAVSIAAGSPVSGDTSLLVANDLAALPGGGDLRVLPVAGTGGPQNIRDVIEAKVDIALVQLNVLNNFRRSSELLAKWQNEIVYIAKLYTEEVHIVAQPQIVLMSQLQGQKVNLDAMGSSTSYVMRDVFKRLGIKIVEVNYSQAEALERMRAGEIAAMVLSTGKPAPSLNTQSIGQAFHFISVPFFNELAEDYIAASLTHEDYPYMIPEGQKIETVGSSVILICFNWQRSHERYRRIQKFVEIFFPKITELQKPPYQAKWREVNFAAKVNGWPRFAPADAWVAAESAKAPTQLKAQFKEFLAVLKAQKGQGQLPPEEAEQLFREFLLWNKAKEAHAAPQYR